MPSAAQATVDTYTVNHQAWMPDLEVPFVIARVRLDDAPDVILTTNIVNCPVDAVDFGDKVQVTFEEQDGIWFPLFEKGELTWRAKLTSPASASLKSACA